jgi:predicted NodU family carbamoyl transferase
MTILCLCREQHHWKLAPGYADAFRRRGIEFFRVDDSIPFDASLEDVLQTCPGTPSTIFHFESAHPPFMILTALVRPEKRSVIPSVTYVDGSARPQTVAREVNPLYYRLIDEFDAVTGVPVIMNTSFNLRGKAIVHTPTDALRTFFSSGMDALVVGSSLVEK